MSYTRGHDGAKDVNKRRLEHYRSLLTNHGDEEVVNSLDALMSAVAERLNRKARARRAGGRRQRKTA